KTMKARFTTEMTQMSPLLLGAACLMVSGSPARADFSKVPFAPENTAIARVDSPKYAFTKEARASLQPSDFDKMTQEQIDQIYFRLTAGPIPDGPMMGTVVFGKDQKAARTMGELLSTLGY